MGIGKLRPFGDLIGIRKLRDGDFILVRMPGPSTVHKTVRLVSLILFQDFECTGVELSVGAAGIKGCHAADGMGTVLMANLRHEYAEVLKERDIVRDGIAVGQNP